VEVAGGRLWYEEAGEGPSILLLHAGAADSRMWDAQWESFTEKFHTIRVDLPGSGHSPYPEGPWDPNEYVLGLLDRLGVEKVAPVGVALGGTIAVDFAIRHPDRTWALVATSVADHGRADALPDLRSAEVFTLLVAGRPSRAADLYLDLWCPLRTSPDIDARIHEMVHDNITMLTEIPKGYVTLAGWSEGDQLLEIRVPTLVIWGDKDERAVQVGAQRLATRVRHAVAMVLPGVDHLVPMRAPQVFTDEVLNFLVHAAAPAR
jgi:pimeloyl-ACP methyl ester carboxylesterase